MANPDPDSTATQTQPAGTLFRDEHAADRELVDRVIANDPEAIEELFFKRLGPTLSFLADRLGVEDQTGALFIHLSEDGWRRLKTWAGRSSLKTWLALVASRFFSALAKKSRPVEPLRENRLDSGAEEPADNFLRSESRSAVLQAVQAMPNERYKLAITMRYLQEMELKEIAEALDVSVAYASLLLHRGLKYLRMAMDGGTQDV